MGWKENEFGLLVPDAPYRYGSPPAGLKRLRSMLGDKYLLAKSRRRVTPGVTDAPEASDLGPWELRALQEHVQGRGEESVRVLIGVAFLRSAGLIGRDDAVGCKGAEYQRGSGTALYDAAHRFPCNPLINGWSLPTRAKTPRLGRALERPLERTDYLPKLMNYADRLFERCGACEAVAEVVRLVMHEQKDDQPVHINLIRHAAGFELLPAYKGSYARALGFEEANEMGVDLLEPSAVEQWGEALRAGPQRPQATKAKKNLDLVRCALWHSAFVASRHGEPFMMLPENIKQYADRLKALNIEYS